MNTSRNRHAYTLNNNICIHQSFTGSRRLTEGLQYMNTFFPEIFSYIDSIGVDFDDDDDPSHKKKPQPCTARKKTGSHPFHMHDKNCSSHTQSSTAYFFFRLLNNSLVSTIFA